MRLARHTKMTFYSHTFVSNVSVDDLHTRTPVHLYIETTWPWQPIKKKGDS